MLSADVFDVRGCWPVTIVGDFKAWTLEWGSQTRISKGRVLREATAGIAECLDLIHFLRKGPRVYGARHIRERRFIQKSCLAS